MVRSPLSRAHEVEDEEEFYEVLQAAEDMPVVVLFGAKWCPQCVTLTPCVPGAPYFNILFFWVPFSDNKYTKMSMIWLKKEIDKALGVASVLECKRFL